MEHFIGDTLLVEKYRIQYLLEQATDLVKTKQLGVEQTVLLIGNLIDLDIVEPETELQLMVVKWLENMEQYYN